MRKLVLVLAAVAMTATPVFAASERFGLEFRVERTDADRLDLATCLATVQRASQQLGYVQMMVKTYPDQLTYLPPGGRAAVVP